MDDKHVEVFRQYDLKVYNLYRARGAFLIETNQGLKLLKNFEGSKNHLLYENRIKEVLVQNGCKNIDLVVPNKAGEYITEDSTGVSYIVKNWFLGEECNLKDLEDVYQSSSNLARLHVAMKGISISEEERAYVTQTSILECFEKHNRELKRVRSYVRDKKQRNEFEVNFLTMYDSFYEEAVRATGYIAKSSYEELAKESVEQGYTCHGSYTYHNLLKHKDTIATTNFEKACLGVQVTDLYQFMRKCLEKNDWSLEYGQSMIEGYNSVKPLSKKEWELLYIMLLYPEKFWKVTNFYFNNKKSWISKRNIQKLLSLEEQSPLKTKFLQDMFSDVF